MTRPPLPLTMLLSRHTRTARVHHAARRRGGGVAARCARAAARSDAAHRRAIAAAADDPVARPAIAAFLQGLAIGLDRRPQCADRHPLGAGNAADIRKHAAELVALAPDVILAHCTATVAPLLRATRTIPIVFRLPDPVGAGFVDSLARPGGNATGFMIFEYSLEREMAGAAQRDRAGRDASGSDSGSRPKAGLSANLPRSRRWRRRRHGGCPVNVRDAAEIERAIAAFARAPNGGLIVTSGPGARRHRTDHRARGPAQAARGLLRALLRHSRRPDLLRARYHRPVPPGGGLRRSHPEGREAGRPAGAGADQVRDWWSTSRPQRRSASPCRHRCSPAPTR